MEYRKVKVYLIRHGATKGNREGRYVGSTDEPILDVGELPDCYKYIHPAKIIVSPLLRCRQTAERIFPDQDQQICEELIECDFGDFEYKNYEELNGNPDYQRFIDTMGESSFPNGESKKEFQRRCIAAFQTVITKHKGEDVLVFVVHGGTIMAILDRFSEPHKDYYDWQVRNLEGFVMDVVAEGEDIQCTNIKKV